MTNKLSKGTLDISMPMEVMDFGRSILKPFIEKNNLSTKIQGRQYVNVDGWKFAGNSFGLTAITERPEQVHVKGDYIRVGYEIAYNPKYKKESEVIGFVGWESDLEQFNLWKNKCKHFNREAIRPYFAYKCIVNIKQLSSGEIIGSGEGFCSNMEIAKATFDEYSINSMAQTRAIGKAYRNQIGYIINDAGFESTPAEEMDGMSEPPETYNQDTTNKKGMNERLMQKAIERIMSGDLEVYDNCKEVYSLNTEQDERLKNAIKELKRKRNDRTRRC